MIFYILGLIVSLFFLWKGAEYANHYSSKIASLLKISGFMVSFFIVAVISTSPETTISIISAIKGIPEFGIGTLFGSNVTDLTLVFAIVAFFSLKGIKIESRAMKGGLLYLLFLSIPILLGLDGKFSRIDGIVLIVCSLVFFYIIFLTDGLFEKNFKKVNKTKLSKNLFLLILSIAVIIVSAYFTLQFSLKLATLINISPILISVIIVAIGTCLPELAYSIRAVRTNSSLALGDILGTVIIDATLIVGITAIISPFEFEKSLIYLTGFAMLVGACITIYFLKSDRVLTKKEGIILVLFYLLFVFLELFSNGFFN